MKSILFSTSQTSNTLLDNLRYKKEFEKYNFIGILDDNIEKYNHEYYNLNVIGKWSEISALSKNEKLTHFALGLAAVKHVTIKEALFINCIELGLQPIESIHPSCYISKSAKVGKGSLFLPFVMVGVDTIIGDNCLLSSHVSILENCTLENNVSVHTSFIGGGCYIEKNVYIGPGSTIGSGVHIGSNTIVGAGSTVLKDLPANSICFGNPVSIVKQNNAYVEPPKWMTK